MGAKAILRGDLHLKNTFLFLVLIVSSDPKSSGWPSLFTWIFALTDGVVFLFIYLCVLVFLAAQGFSSCGRWGSSSLQCSGFSLQWPLLLRSSGSGHIGVSSCGTGLVSPGCTRDPPRPETELVSCISRRILNHWASRKPQLFQPTSSGWSTNCGPDIRPFPSQKALEECCPRTWKFT